MGLRMYVITITLSTTFMTRRSFYFFVCFSSGLAIETTTMAENGYFRRKIKSARGGPHHGVSPLRLMQSYRE